MIHFIALLTSCLKVLVNLELYEVTIAARNLSHNRMLRCPSDTNDWQGHSLPGLGEELAMMYHNEYIRQLLCLDLDYQKLCDETLLAAVVILGTNEEMLHEADDKELFLRIASLLIDARLPLRIAIPHTSTQVFNAAVDSGTCVSPSTRSTSDLFPSDLRQACFWTSLRQDRHAASFKQQSVKVPLARCEDFRQLSPATDTVWAHRTVMYCADVLEFCYGSESVEAIFLLANTCRERWQELWAHDDSLRTALPPTFEPVHCCEPERG